MIRGLGTDLVTISRMDRLSPHQKERMFSSFELAKAASLPSSRQGEFFASRFAAKEAFSKALGTGIRGFDLTEVSVECDDLGAPYFVFSGNALALVGEDSFLLSISHEGDMALAVVVCNGKE